MDGDKPGFLKRTQDGFLACKIAPPAAALRDLFNQAATDPAPVDAQLDAIDDALARAKAAMDPHEHDPSLRRVLQAVDLYAPLKATIRRTKNGQAVTNAWLKMYEIASQMHIPEAVGTMGPDGALALRVFCNAELPGAFVCALNHYMATRHPGSRLDWVASSLYPDKAGEILGDEYGLYARNPDRWLMSAALRGDVTNVTDLAALAARARASLHGLADLYTSDAGIDVAGDYNRQEELTARINLGQILAGLLTLRVGGAMVTKTYTFTRPYSVAVVSVCAALFETFCITKPVTSRPTNSEVYFVGLGFRGISPETERVLLNAVSGFDFSRPVAPLNAPSLIATRASIRVAASQIHGEQVEYLTEAMGFFTKFRREVGGLEHQLRLVGNQVQSEWLEANNVFAISTACHLSAFGPGSAPPRRQAGGRSKRRRAKAGDMPTPQ